MKRFLIIVMAATVAALCVGTIIAQYPAQTGDSVVGSWRLVSYEDRYVNGRVDYPWGEHPSGLLIYDRAGNMSVQIQRTPTAGRKPKNEAGLTRAEKERLVDGYTAYFGKYVVDWTNMTITHIVEGNLFAFYIGTSQVKKFEIGKDQLTLLVTWFKNGKPVNGRRVFQRVSQ